MAAKGHRTRLGARVWALLVAALIAGGSLIIRPAGAAVPSGARSAPEAKAAVAP